MEKFVKLLSEFGFERTNLPFNHDEPLVVHAVAGAGKTKLTRTFLGLETRARAYTTQTPDCFNILCTNILAAKDRETVGPFDILDEYPPEKDRSTYKVILADPYQHAQPSQRPHYYKTTSFRCPQAITHWLRLQNFDIWTDSSSEFIGKVTEQGIYGPKPQGLTLAVGKEAERYLHGYVKKPKHPSEVIGQEFAVVTLICSIADLTKATPEERVKVYVGATRAAEELYVRRWFLLPPTTRPLEGDTGSG